MKRSLAELADPIRSKYQALKQSESAFQTKQKRFFKPLLEKDVDSDNVRADNEMDVDEELVNQAVNPTENEISLYLTTSDDKTYGIRKLRGAWFLGSFPINLRPSGITVAGKTYPCTTGLISLLTQREPHGYSDNDLQNYVQILKDTSHHLNVARQNLKLPRGKKYNNVIKKCFPEYPLLQAGNNEDVSFLSARDQSMVKTSTPNRHFSIPGHSRTNREANESDSTLNIQMGQSVDNMRAILNSGLERMNKSLASSSKEGAGGGLCGFSHLLERNKIIKASNRGNKCQYRFWNDVNELVERLAILHSSKRAGNTSVINEILNIEEESRECNYIY